MCWSVPMGCINSKRDSCPTVFQVVNVDDLGRQLNAGQIEVTDTDLVFYQRGKPPIRWPLKTLRRYGFDAEHFSFEAGRRSPTGAGIFAFVCRRAEQLVGILETRLQVRPHNEGESEGDTERRVTHRLNSIGSGGPLSPLGSTNPILETPVTPSSRPVSQNIYVNEEIIVTATITSTNSQDETNNNTMVDSGAEHAYTNTLLGGSDNDEANTTGHVYMNIVPGTNSVLSEYRAQPQPQQIVPWEQDEPLHNYANLDVENEIEILSRQIEPHLPKPILNYITLDLDRGGDPPPPRSPSNSLPPDSPRKAPMGYATIDFDKTTALSHSVDPAFDDSDCSRKTRHNSTIGHLPNSSSLSE